MVLNTNSCGEVVVYRIFGQSTLVPIYVFEFSKML